MAPAATVPSWWRKANISYHLERQQWLEIVYSQESITLSLDSFKILLAILLCSSVVWWYCSKVLWSSLCWDIAGSSCPAHELGWTHLKVTGVLQNVCNIITKTPTVGLTLSKGIQTGPELLWAPQLIKLPASLGVLSGHFYPEWTQSCFCRVRWTKRNVLLVSCTTTELAQSNSWLSQKEQEVKREHWPPCQWPWNWGRISCVLLRSPAGFQLLPRLLQDLLMPAQAQPPPSLTFTTWPEFFCLLFGD